MINLRTAKALGLTIAEAKPACVSNSMGLMNIVAAGDVSPSRLSSAACMTATRLVCWGNNRGSGLNVGVGVALPGQ